MELNDKQTGTRRSTNQMLELLNEYDKTNGLTIKAFCELHHINLGSFYTARKNQRLRTGRAKQATGFISIGKPTHAEPVNSLFAEVNGIRLYQAVAADYLKALVS